MLPILKEKNVTENSLAVPYYELVSLLGDGLIGPNVNGIERYHVHTLVEASYGCCEVKLQVLLYIIFRLRSFIRCLLEV